jgi:hypothetical protein
MSTVRANTILDSSGGNTATVNGVTIALSSQAQAEAGTDNTTQMTPLRSLQAGVGAPHFVLEDQKASGTNGQSCTLNTWVTRDLNTEVRDPQSIVTITSNEFTVTTNCWVEWTVPGRDVFQTRLYNVTDAVAVSVGQTTGNNASISISVGGGACLAGKTYRIEHNTSSTQISGTARGVGTELYTRVRGWRTT